MMNLRASFPAALLAFAFLASARAQIDSASLQQRAAEASTATQQALQKCTRALQAVRAAIGDPENKVQGDCNDIENVLKGETFDAALGCVPIALDHLEYIAEDRRAATKSAITALRAELEAGSLALQRQEALQELATRMEYLAAMGSEDDASSALVDLAASVGKATRSAALPRAGIAELQQHLAKRRQANMERLAKDLLVQAKAELAQLQQDFASMRTEMSSQDAADRDRGFARFDEAARSITTALSRVPDKDQQAPQADLAKLATVADELYRKAYGAATLARMQENWATTADQFEGWRDEAVAITAQGYVDFDPPNVDVLASPRTVAMVARANAWLAFVGQDADCVRNQHVASVLAFTKSAIEQRDAAHQKLLPLAKVLVEGFAAIELSEDRIRGRLQTFADWDLPLALQNHPEQRGLTDRVHALLDAHDRKTLGDDKALATIREQAMTAAEGLWSRSQQWLPVQGGFDAPTAPLFVGKLMRLEGVWLRTSEFDAGRCDVAFDLAGHVFAASLTKGVAAAVKSMRTRLQLLPVDGLSTHEPCELLAIVGAATELSLLGAKGAADAMVVPARRLQIIGLRQGAVFVVAP